MLRIVHSRLHDVQSKSVKSAIRVQEKYQVPNANPNVTSRYEFNAQRERTYCSRLPVFQLQTAMLFAVLNALH